MSSHIQEHQVTVYIKKRYDKNKKTNTKNGDNMKNYSIWKKDNQKTSYPSLENDLEVDVLIIGGGLTGISSLYHLRKSNLKVVLVEQNKIGYGITGNSTGKLNVLQNDLLDKIRNYYNDDIASLYLSSQIEAIKDIMKAIKDKPIQCNLEKVETYLYTNQEKEIKKLKELKVFLQNNHLEIKDGNNMFVESKYMIKGSSYIINPLKLIKGLIKNNPFPIYEKTSIKKIIKKKNSYICYTKNHHIKAKYVILACHYPTFIKSLFFPLKVNIEKSYLSSSICPTKPFSLISYSYPFTSIRTYQDSIIYLSNSHIIDTKLKDKNHYKELKIKLKKLNLYPDYLWSNTDIMTSDGLPLIGELEKNLLIATGYNTWGLTSSFLSGKVLRDIIEKRKNPYIDLFSPNRKRIKDISFYIKNIYHNINAYLKSYCISNTSYKCPHMGCKLIYNEIENTYDCPCHGSRFLEDGTIITSPANQIFKKK